MKLRFPIAVTLKFTLSSEDRYHPVDIYRSVINTVISHLQESNSEETRPDFLKRTITKTIRNGHETLE